MNENSRWVGFLIRRIIVHALAGGIFCVLTGGVLGSISGGLVGFLLDFRSTDIARFGLMFGFFVGGIAGASVGPIAMGLVGFFSPPSQAFLPSKRVLGSILRTMALATAGIMTTYFLVAGVVSLVEHHSFDDSLMRGLLIMAYVAPAATGCGIIPGAWRGCRMERRRFEEARTHSEQFSLVEAE